MMQRLYLIPDAEGKTRFEGDRLRRAIEELEGVANFRSGDETLYPEDTLFQCELQPLDSKMMRVPIHVRKNLSSVSIGAFDNRGVKAALEIQRHYGDNIFAFSEESSPDIVSLRMVGSPEELAEKLKLR